MDADSDDTIHGGAKTRVFIVGGGAGGVATAFWLTSTPDLRARFDVTLYTRGWRLGGKGASGRNPQFGDRIEEHGLHLWFGFYQTAFATMRAAYAEWDPPQDSPIKTFDDAFSPIRTVVLEEPEETGWAAWPLVFPPWPGQVGEPEQTTVEQLVSKGVLMLQAHVDALAASPGLVGGAADILHALSEALESGLASGVQALAVRPLQGLQAALSGLRAVLGIVGEPDAAAGAVAAAFSLTEQRLLILINLGLSLLVGYLVDILPVDRENNHQAAYDALDEQEYRAWLSKHGAWNETVNASPVRCLYDLAFAYRGGDTSSLDNGALACGVTLKLIESLIFGYRDAPLWKMNAGMGDVMFAPLYDVLTKRGVIINFFHALTDVLPSDDGKRIASLTFNRQALPKAAPYEPLISIKGLRCWPSQPDWAQLQLDATLQTASVNFESVWDETTAGTLTIPLAAADLVVMAVPPEMLKLTTGRLRDNPHWSAMLDNSASVATQAVQFWLSVESSQLGAPFTFAPRTALAEPMDTWCDMSHLLPSENWAPPAATPLAIAYFCGALDAPLASPRLPDPGSQRLATLQSETSVWLTTNIGRLWPGVAAPGGGLQADVLASSYYRANYEPSDLYVQVPPGSVRHRLAPDSRVFENLYLAGDWTRVPMSGGCVENAVLSGLLAAEAISGVAMPRPAAAPPATARQDPVVS